MFRLLGPHITRGSPDVLAGWKPPAVVVLSPAAEQWARVPPTMPQTRFVWRLAQKQQPDFEQPLDAAAEARRWMSEALSSVQGIVGGYWQGLDEVAIGSQQAMVRYAAFEVERVRLLAAQGARAGVGAFAPGTPGDLGWWRSFLPALQAARDQGGVLLLHESAWPRLGSGECPELRHRKVYGGDASCGWEGIPAQQQVPLIITKCGWDGQAVRPGWVQGWQGALTGHEYLRQLDWYSEELTRDEYVLGACVYCLSDPPAEAEEQSYNIWPDLAKAMAQHATPLYRVTGERARGVDVSEWRGKPDWKRVAESGVTFALLRASVGTKQDREWLRNVRDAQAAKLVVLPWHYQTPDDGVSEQVRAHLRIIGSDWPLTWTDVETTKGVPLTDAAVRAFVTGVQQAGLKIGMYTSAYMVVRCGITPWAARLPRWLADWNPRYFGRPRLPLGWSPGWDIQQTTSKGVVPGIQPPVDLDIFNGTVEELAAWCAA